MSEKEEKEQTPETGNITREGIEKYGQITIYHKEEGERTKANLSVITIIGEIEGHECLSQNTKTTKYEHMLPLLAGIEENEEIDGVLFLLNTVGGDVECGLAIAELIASLSKPSVSLVLGGSHSIGGPLACSTNYSFIVPTATMILHPVRMSGTIIGAPSTYEQFAKMQERIIGFMAGHSHASEERLLELTMNTKMLTKDLGTILVGEEAVKEGLIDQVGGMKDAFYKINKMCGYGKN